MKAILNGHEHVVHLVQLLLPLRDSAGRKIPRTSFDNVETTLGKCFGGLTSYTRHPTTGLWGDTTQASSVQDLVVVYEVMVDKLDPDWWGAYRTELEVTFGQEVLAVRALRMQHL